MKSKRIRSRQKTQVLSFTVKQFAIFVQSGANSSIISFQWASSQAS
jgi:hypothetical protein